MPILTPDERLGQCVDARYRLGAVLSTGGMGVLFAGLDLKTGRRVAVKMLKPALAFEPDKVARFSRETRIALELRHPHIAPVLDVWTDEADVPFLIMDLLEGRSLAKELEARGTLPVSEALAIAIPVANALAAAHRMGVVHRDVKPGNIFLCRGPGDDSRAGTSGSVPMLLDFGIAKSFHDAFETETGLVVGTPGYMAPEQAQHGECGPFTDIWGLGAVLYRCLMGHPPHGGSSAPEILRMLLCDPVAPVAARGVSRAVCATIDRALARDPHLRYGSMEAFARALVQAADPRGDEPTTEAFPAFEPFARDSYSRPIVGSSGGMARLRRPAWLSLGLVCAWLLFVRTGPDEVRRIDSKPGPLNPFAGDVSLMRAAPEAPTTMSSGEDLTARTDRRSALAPLRSPPGPDESNASAPTMSRGSAVTAIGTSRPSTKGPPGPASSAGIAGSSPNADIEREAVTGLPIVIRW